MSLSLPLTALDVHRISTGIFAGLGVTVSLVVVPSVAECNDQLPVFKGLYNRGKVLAISSMLIAGASGLCYYSQTGNKLALYSTALAIASGPFTGIVMSSNIKTLFGMDPKDKEVPSRVARWGCQQWARTAFGVGAFTIAVVLLR